MNTAEVLADGFGRVQEGVHHAVDGLKPEQLNTRLDAEATLR